MNKMLTPRQAREKAKATPETIRSLEAKIDGMLLEYFQRGDNEPEIPYSMFPDDVTRNYIINNYRKIGWSIRTVSYEGDPRDGGGSDNYLRFKEKRSRAKSRDYYSTRPIETL